MGTKPACARCKEVGFDEFLLKPATREQLYDLVQTAADKVASKCRPVKQTKTTGGEPV